MIRVRIAYSKGEELLFTGNLDLHKIWERTFRRAVLLLAYSQGFHPQPKIQQACPLPLGFTSDAELVDIWLTNVLDVEEIKNKLTPCLNPGILIRKIAIIPLEWPPLQTQVIAAGYEVIVDPFDGSSNVNESIQRLLNSPTLMHDRRGKTQDLRPLIESIYLLGEDPVMLFMQLTAKPGATGRPELVLNDLGISIENTRIHRTQLILSSGENQ